MSQVIGQTLSLAGMHQDMFNYPFLLDSGIVVADVKKLVALKTSADNTVKLTADDEDILGVLGTFEDRVVEGIKIGTVYTKGVYRVTVTGTVNVGQSLMGSATAGVGKGVTFNGRNLVIAKPSATIADVIFF